MAGAGFGDLLSDRFEEQVLGDVQEDTKDSVQQLEMLGWEGHDVSCKLELTCCAKPLPGSVYTLLLL